MEPVPSHAAAGPIQEREPALLLHLSMVAFTAQETTLMPSPAMNTCAQVSLGVPTLFYMPIKLSLLLSDMFNIFLQYIQFMASGAAGKLEAAV